MRVATMPSFRRIAFLTAVLLAPLALLSVYAMRVDRAAWEVAAVRLLQDSGPPGLRGLSAVLAVAGQGLPWVGIMVAVAALLLAAGSVRLVLLLGIVAALQDVGAVMKRVIERARPPAGLVDVWRAADGYSFPSGHTLGAVLVFGFLFFAVEHCALPRRLRRLLQGLCVAWIVLMGVSRVEVGAHWPTDVLGAYLTGALLLVPVVWVLRRGHPARAPA
jgi:undecaprenyl-diphosphatase